MDIDRAFTGPAEAQAGERSNGAGERGGRVTGGARYRVIGIPGAEPAQKLAVNSASGPLLLLVSTGVAESIGTYMDSGKRPSKKAADRLNGRAVTP